MNNPVPLLDLYSIKHIRDEQDNVIANVLYRRCVNLRIEEWRALLIIKVQTVI